MALEDTENSDQWISFWEPLTRATLRRGLSFILLGLLIATFDLRINGFNLIWDTLGYLIAFIGTAALHRQHRVYGLAQFALAGLMLIGLPDIHNEILARISDLFMITAHSILYGVFAFSFHAGLRDIAREIRREDVARQVDILRLTICAGLALVALTNSVPLLPVLTGYLGAGVGVLYIVSLFYIWRVRRLVGEALPSQLEQRLG